MSNYYLSLWCPGNSRFSVNSLQPDAPSFDASKDLNHNERFSRNDYSDMHPKCLNANKNVLLILFDHENLSHKSDIWSAPYSLRDVCVCARSTPFCLVTISRISDKWLVSVCDDTGSAFEWSACFCTCGTDSTCYIGTETSFLNMYKYSDERESNTNHVLHMSHWTPFWSECSVM